MHTLHTLQLLFCITVNITIRMSEDRREEECPRNCGGFIRMVCS